MEWLVHFFLCRPSYFPQKICRPSRFAVHFYKIFVFIFLCFFSLTMRFRDEISLAVARGVIIEAIMVVVVVVMVVMSVVMVVVLVVRIVTVDTIFFVAFRVRMTAVAIVAVPVTIWTHTFAIGLNHFF